MSTTKLEEIEALSADLSREERLTLIEHIARQLRRSERSNPQPLYGVWKGKFPEDADIDEALREIRTGRSKDEGATDQ
jgi:hypothetical protein